MIAEPISVDQLTGEILSTPGSIMRVATEQPDPGALPEAVLDSFRQYA